MNALKLREIPLSKGRHKSPEQGVCLMEVVSYVAGEAFSDHPKCACPCMSRFLRRWNDDLDDEGRQMLKQFVPLLVNSNLGTKVANRRMDMLEEWFYTVYMASWLELSGQHDAAEHVHALRNKSDWSEIRKQLGIEFSGASQGDELDEVLQEHVCEATGRSGAAAETLRWQRGYLAFHAAYYAAVTGGLEALNGTVIKLQQSALQLVRDCLAVKEIK